MNIYKYKLESVCYKAAKLIIILIWYSSNGNEVACLLSKGRCAIKKGSVMFCYFFFFCLSMSPCIPGLEMGPTLWNLAPHFLSNWLPRTSIYTSMLLTPSSTASDKIAALIARGNGAGVRKFSVSLSPGHHRTCVCSAIWMVLSKYCNLQKQ